MRKIKKILITAGPTREHLDPVRFLTNLSTGEMGYALAEAACAEGFKTTLVSGPVGLVPPRGVRFFPVVSARQMLRKCKELFPSHDGLIMTAAVCDFMPLRPCRQKIPSSKGLKLQLRRTPDILATLARRKGDRVVIGFCLETRDLIKRAKSKIGRKKLDGIVANYYDSKRYVPFGKRKVKVAMIDKGMNVRSLPAQSKKRLAKVILRWMAGIR